MRLKVSLLLASIFFLLGVFTLAHYGINWDTINHLPRGQAYLHYFLTGKKDYSDLPPLFNDWTKKNEWYFQNPKSLFIDANIPRSLVPTRSMYQNDGTTYSYFIQHDGDGHPPLSDILSSGFNRVFFGKLRLVNDIDSYRVYGVLLAALLVGLLYYWSSSIYGRFAGFVSALALATYPLFWAESHFNTEKDIPETVFWSFLFFCIWKAVKQKSSKWAIMSGVFFGLALGTKFNVLFAIFAIVPWFLFVLARDVIKKEKELISFKKSNILLYISFVAALLVGLAIFVGTWPYLWADPIARVQSVINFYKEIGTTTSIDPRYIGPFNINTYPFQWVVFTTPIITLFLGVVGAIYSITRIKKEKYLESLLFLLWLIVPIARVSFQSSNTYGGMRQIMEYIPALAMLAGMGAYTLVVVLKSKTLRAISLLLIVLGFSLIIIKIKQIHPNENVYFNELVGGLSGAKSDNIPYWGFSFGAPYRQGIEWVNDHAEQGANLVYAYELIPNIPRLFVRPDLVFNNAARSGYLRKGEYVITLTYQGTNVRSYFDKYLETFLNPAYEVDVDGVSILKVWKNSDEYLKVHFSEKLAKDAKLKTTLGGISFDLGQTRKLSRIEFTYNDKACAKLVSSYTIISVNQKDWVRLPGVLPDDWRISLLGEQPKDGHFIEPFVGEEARYVNFNIEPTATCMKNIKNFKVYYFE